MSIPFLSNLDLTGNEIQNVKLQVLATNPASPAGEGQIYYNSTSKKIMWHNGTEFITLPLTASELLAIINAGVTLLDDDNLSANANDAITKKHSQNTDTGTTAASFQLDSGNSGVKIKNSAGVLEVRNAADNAYADLKVNNLTVEGTTVTIHAETLTIADNVIVLNSNVTGTPTEDGGIEIERGTATNASILWDENNDVWKAGLAGAEVVISLDGHIHSAATISVDGFMSASDKVRLNGMEDGANNYVHPTDDGNLHVPATGTTNNGKVLTAGSTAGSFSWETSASGIQKHAQAIAGENTSEVITHNLNTRDITVLLYEAASPYKQAMCDVEMTSVNTITLKFSVAPTSGQYRVVITG